MKSRALAVVAGGLLLGAAACGGDPDRAEGRVALEPCPPAEEGVDALCGVLEVFENREAASGRTIPLKIVVLPALVPNPMPDPLFVLAGGPGQAATELIDVVRTAFRGVNGDRDIVLVDQRGTGSSNGLECDLDEESMATDRLVFDPLADPVTRDEAFAGIRACLDQADADVRWYTTPVAMDDLDEVRVALGYEQINLWGGSYGTRAALIYLRRHQAHARTAIIDGVAPVSMRLPLNMGVDAAAALELTLAACEGEDGCAKAFPRVRAQLSELLERLERTPVRTRLADPYTGRSLEAVLTRTAVVQLLRSMLYSPELTALVPLTIDRAHAGDFQPLAATRWGSDAVELSIGMFFSVVCNEDIGRISAEERRQLESEEFMGGTQLALWGAVCEFWPRAELPESYFEPVRSDVPTLILSGVLDPVTPPRWGDEAGAHLSNSLHVEVPGFAHNTLAAGCVDDLMEQLLDEASVANLDPSCVERHRRPPFFRSQTGPHGGGS